MKAIQLIIIFDEPKPRLPEEEDLDQLYQDDPEEYEYGWQYTNNK